MSSSDDTGKTTPRKHPVKAARQRKSPATWNGDIFSGFGHVLFPTVRSIMSDRTEQKAGVDKQKTKVLSWVAQGWRAFFAIASVLALASIAGHRGFEWRGYIAEVIDWYKKTFVPFDDYVLKPIFHPLFRYLNIELTPVWLDFITLFVLAFGAANVESMTRHGEALIVQFYRAFTSSMDDRTSTFFSASFLDRLVVTLFVPLMWIAIITHVLLSYLLVRDIFGYGIFVSVILAVVALLIIFALWQLTVLGQGPPIFGKQFLSTLFYIISGLLIMPMIAIISLLVLLSSPVLAWRTSLICCSIFAALALVNRFSYAFG